MTNREIAHVLFNIATLLELAEGNPYRIRAYRRAARGMLRLNVEAKDLLAAGGELPLPGLGKRLRAKIGQLVQGGRMAFYEELIAEQHPAIQALMAVPGVGPKTAGRLFTELHLTSPDAAVRSRGFSDKAALLAELGRYPEARAVLEEGMAQDTTAGRPELRGGKQLALAYLALREGRPATARGNGRPAVPILRGGHG